MSTAVSAAVEEPANPSSQPRQRRAGPFRLKDANARSREQPAHATGRTGAGSTWRRWLFTHTVPTGARLPAGVAYTIVHPGGLTDHPGGRRQLLVGKRDEFMGSGGPRSVPRADVAEVRRWWWWWWRGATLCMLALQPAAVKAGRVVDWWIDSTNMGAFFTEKQSAQGVHACRPAPAAHASSCLHLPRPHSHRSRRRWWSRRCCCPMPSTRALTWSACQRARESPPGTGRCCLTKPPQGCDSAVA